MNKFEKLDEKYSSSVEYEFSGKLVGYKKNEGILGDGILVAAELELAYFQYNRSNSTVCFSGKFTPERLVFCDLLYRGYEEGLFDSISIKSKEKSVFYFSNGELVNKEYIEIICSNSPEENWFKQQIKDEPGTIF